MTTGLRTKGQTRSGRYANGRDVTRVSRSRRRRRHASPSEKHNRDRPNHSSSRLLHPCNPFQLRHLRHPARACVARFPMPESQPRHPVTQRQQKPLSNLTKNQLQRQPRRPQLPACRHARAAKRPRNSQPCGARRAPGARARTRTTARPQSLGRLRPASARRPGDHRALWSQTRWRGVCANSWNTTFPVG
mgnify:CR=1 FL=1